MKDNWRCEMEEEVLALFNMGYTVRQVSEKIHRSFWSVKNLKQELIESGKIEPSPTSKKWTYEEIVKAKRMDAKGRSKQEIARELGRSIGSVRSKLSLLGMGIGDPTQEEAKNIPVSAEHKKIIELDQNAIKFLRFKMSLKKEIEATGEFRGREVTFVNDRYFVIVHQNYRETLSYQDVYVRAGKGAKK